MISINKKGKLSDKTTELIKKFKKKHRYSTEETRIDFQSLFTEFDKLVDLPKEQNVLLEKLAGPKYLKLGLKLKKSGLENASEEGERSEAEEDVRKHELVYNHDDHIYKDYLKRIENETLSVYQIHPSILNRINYKNLSDSYFETILTSYPHLADVTHESFLVKWAEYFDAYIKRNKGESVINAISKLSSNSETF